MTEKVKQQQQQQKKTIRKSMFYKALFLSRHVVLCIDTNSIKLQSAFFPS